MFVNINFFLFLVFTTNWFAISIFEDRNLLDVPQGSHFVGAPIDEGYLCFIADIIGYI